MRGNSLFFLDFIVHHPDILPFPDPDPLSARPMEALCTAQSEAAQALGRLDGLLRFCPPEPLPLLAARIIRETLTAALRQEGHQFTDARFHAWFAGLVPLSDDALQFAPAPRGIVTALLQELSHNRWAPLADAATGLEAALLAIREAGDASARATAEGALAEAHALVRALDPAPLPFPSLAALHRAIDQSPRFAQAERATDTIAFDNIQFVVERPRPPSPRWAIELVFGEHLHAANLVSAALPLPGLVRLDTVQDETGDEPVLGAIRQSEALRDALLHLVQTIDEVARYHAGLAARYSGHRSNARAPRLCGLLTGFGPLRSAQIEPLLGATRLGVRTMLKALAGTGDLAVATIAGVKLYSVRHSQTPSPAASSAGDRDRFSSEAIDAYEAATARIDAVLARQAGTCETKG